MLSEWGVQGYRTPQARDPNHQGRASIGLNLSGGHRWISQYECRMASFLEIGSPPSMGVGSSANRTSVGASFAEGRQ
jgi:hypothetical protein